MSCDRPFITNSEIRSMPRKVVFLLTYAGFHLPRNQISTGSGGQRKARSSPSAHHQPCAAPVKIRTPTF
eukprot:s5014_g2.t1